MNKIKSFNELMDKIEVSSKSFILLYKGTSEQSMCAFNNLENALKNDSTVNLFTVNVDDVRDIHSHYKITSVPTLLIFEKSNMTGLVKGCHEENYYKLLAEGGLADTSTVSGTDKPVNRVTVYSTPTCSWCNTLKTWLNKNNIRYTDIDVSADQRAAEELVRRSGQQGVPQTDINGEIIVGFNQPRLKELLGIS
jgi:glutaredoxin-like YruB-family protein